MTVMKLSHKEVFILTNILFHLTGVQLYNPLRVTVKLKKKTHKQ